MVVLLFYLFHLPLVRPRSCHRRLVFQTQIWTAALDFTALKCISRKILPSCERVIFRKKRRKGLLRQSLERIVKPERLRQRDAEQREKDKYL